MGLLSDCGIKGNDDDVLFTGRKPIGYINEQDDGKVVLVIDSESIDSINRFKDIPTLFEFCKEYINMHGNWSSGCPVCGGEE